MNHLLELNKESNVKLLQFGLNEFLRVQQDISFNGSSEDRKDLEGYCVLVLESILSNQLRGTYKEWSWEEYLKIKRNWNGKKTPEDLLEYVIYNLGEYESSMHTGEKWAFEGKENNVLYFVPTMDSIILKFNQLKDLKENYVFIKDIVFKNNRLEIIL